MSGNTKGPWSIHKQEASSFVETLTGAGHYDAPYYAVVSANGDVICDNGQYYAQEVDPKNMHLIAAAPDLLEALESVSKKLDLYQWMQNCVDKRAQGSFGIAVSIDDQAVQWQALNDELRLIQNARIAAIARAKGIKL